MPDYIHYETKTDRELLIVVAEAINSLNERTAQLCVRAEKLDEYAETNKERISNHDVQIAEILKENALVNKQTSETLVELHSLVANQNEKIEALAPISKFFWWVIASIGALIIAILVAVIKHVLPGG
jgi:hypothetical protein